MTVATPQDFAEELTQVELPWEQIKKTARQGEAEYRQFIGWVRHTISIEAFSFSICLRTRKVVCVPDPAWLSKEVADIILAQP